MPTASVSTCRPPAPGFPACRGVTLHSRAPGGCRARPGRRPGRGSCADRRGRCQLCDPDCRRPPDAGHTTASPLRAARAGRRLPRLGGCLASPRSVRKADIAASDLASPRADPGRAVAHARRRDRSRAGRRLQLQPACRASAMRVPDYIAHIAGNFFPDDPGRSGKIHGWEKLQWNFLPTQRRQRAGGMVQPAGRPPSGRQGRGRSRWSTPGVAFRNWRTFKRSPDFSTAPGSRTPATSSWARSATVAAPTPTRWTARATAPSWPARSPRRPTTTTGSPASPTRPRSCRCACWTPRATATPRRSPPASATPCVHGAQVINLSIEFSPGTTSGQIPDVVSAITYAHNHGVVVVGAAGNDEDNSLDYPAALPDVISVGATTQRPLPGGLLGRRQGPGPGGARRRRRRRVGARLQLPSRCATCPTSTR